MLNSGCFITLIGRTVNLQTSSLIFKTAAVFPLCTSSWQFYDVFLKLQDDRAAQSALFLKFGESNRPLQTAGKCPRPYPVSRPYLCCLYFTANLSQGAGVWRLTRHNLNLVIENGGSVSPRML